MSSSQVIYDPDVVELSDRQGRSEGGQLGAGEPERVSVQVPELRSRNSHSFIDVVEISGVEQRGQSWKGKGVRKELAEVKPVQHNTVKLEQFGYSFWDPQIATQRRKYFKVVFRAMLLTILLTWACLPIYFGSLSSSASHVGNLEAWYVNRDQGRIGNNLQATVQDAMGKPGTLGWRIIDSDDAGNNEDIMNAVLGEMAWLVVVAERNATSNLSNARLVGNTSYDPSSAITVYYAQARNEVASANFVVPITTAFLQNFTQSYASGSAQRYFAFMLGSNTTDDNSTPTANVTALQLLAQAPQTISPAVAWRTVNLRPYTAPAAQAVTLVGQIYLCIFAFIMVMAHASARRLVSPFLTSPSYLILRLVAPLALYAPLSISYALVSIAFKLPFGSNSGYTHAGAFLLFMIYIYLGMCSLGLALEAMVTVLTTKYVPFFLVLLIIVNISTAAIPTELQPELYEYATGFPFWNIQQAVRTLLFGTTSHLPKNALVLLAWTLLSCCTLSAFTYLRRKREIAQSGLTTSKGVENDAFERQVLRSRDGSKNSSKDLEMSGLGKKATDAPDDKHWRLSDDKDKSSLLEYNVSADKRQRPSQEQSEENVVIVEAL